MAENELQLAQQAVLAITQGLNITRIVYVDDQFEAGFDVEIIKGWLINIEEGVLNQIREFLPGVPLDVEQNITFIELEKIWKEWPEEKQKDVAIRISAILGTSTVKDQGIASRLETYFPIIIKPQTMSPSGWEAQEEGILNSADPQSKILCIFDQDLSGASSKGFTSEGTKSGIGLIQRVVNRGKDDAVICCLLSQTIPTIEDEFIVWRKLAEENGLNLSQFLPLAKVRLTEGNSPLLFADGIKKAALNTYCEKWKQSAKIIIQESTTNAIAQVMKVDVYDFDHMIFKKSFEEGVWEIDTLIRLFQIFHRDEIRELILDPHKSTELNNLIAASRLISEVAINHDISKIFPQIRPIRKKELFEPASLVLHTPLDVGDLFVNEKEQLTYILLGQPCDLMVRSNGKRARKRAGEHLVVPLVPLHRLKQKEYEKKPPYHWKTHAPLEYYYQDSNDFAELVFSEAYLISVDILDLAVLDAEGTCRLDLNQLPALPAICTSGWKTHIDNIIKHYSEERGRADKILEHISCIKKQETMELLGQTSTILKFYSKGVFDFGLQRIGRYRRLGADRLLKAYTQYLSRDAEDLDFANIS